MRDLQIVDLHEARDQDGGRVAGSITLGGVIREDGFRDPGHFVAEDVQQALGQADVVGYDHRTILFQQQGTKARAAGDDSFGRVDNVHVMQEWDIKQIPLAWQVDQFLQRADRLVAAAQDQALMRDGMAGRLGAELVRVILVPDEAPEDTFFNDRPGFADQPGQVTFEGIGLKPVGVVDQVEMVRKDFFPDLVFGKEGEAALHQAAVVGDLVHEM